MCGHMRFTVTERKKIIAKIQIRVNVGLIYKETEY